MHTSVAPKNLIFPSQSAGRKAISAHQNTGAQFLIPFVMQKKRGPETWRGARGRRTMGGAIKRPPTLRLCPPYWPSKRG
jgi:hypothetical protein